MSGVGVHYTNTTYYQLQSQVCACSAYVRKHVHLWDKLLSQVHQHSLHALVTMDTQLSTCSGYEFTVYRKLSYSWVLAVVYICLGCHGYTARDISTSWQ